jgi:hypothetical protein
MTDAPVGFGMTRIDGQSFELWRQDDNGRRFLVGRFSALDEAERRRAELACGGHKQIYWISEHDGPPTRKEPA